MQPSVPSRVFAIDLNNRPIMSDIIDVAIVGAGLSGLQAAISLQEQGLSVVILEARDRVGGKTCSIQRPDGKGIQELGAAWLNSSDQSTLWAYAQRFGLRPVVQNVEGSVACEDVDGTCHFFPFSGLPSVSDQPDHAGQCLAIHPKGPCV